MTELYLSPEESYVSAEQAYDVDFDDSPEDFSTNFLDLDQKNNRYTDPDEIHSQKYKLINGAYFEFDQTEDDGEVVGKELIDFGADGIGAIQLALEGGTGKFIQTGNMRNEDGSISKLRSEITITLIGWDGEAPIIEIDSSPLPVEEEEDEDPELDNQIEDTIDGSDATKEENNKFLPTKPSPIEQPASSEPTLVTESYAASISEIAVDVDEEQVDIRISSIQAVNHENETTSTDTDQPVHESIDKINVADETTEDNSQDMTANRESIDSQDNLTPNNDRIETDSTVETIAENASAIKYDNQASPGSSNEADAESFNDIEQLSKEAYRMATSSIEIIPSQTNDQIIQQVSTDKRIAVEPANSEHSTQNSDKKITGETLNQMDLAAQETNNELVLNNQINTTTYEAKVEMPAMEKVDDPIMQTEKYDQITVSAEQITKDDVVFEVQFNQTETQASTDTYRQSDVASTTMQTTDKPSATAKIMKTEHTVDHTTKHAIREPKNIEDNTTPAPEDIAVVKPIDLQKPAETYVNEVASPPTQQAEINIPPTDQVTQTESARPEQQHEDYVHYRSNDEKPAINAIYNNENYRETNTPASFATNYESEAKWPNRKPVASVWSRNEIKSGPLVTFNNTPSYQSINGSDDTSGDIEFTVPYIPSTQRPNRPVMATMQVESRSTT